MKGKLTIDIRCKEREVIESCLNYKHSNINPELLLLFYALGVGMHIDKLYYYIKLIESS